MIDIPPVGINSNVGHRLDPLEPVLRRAQPSFCVCLCLRNMDAYYVRIPIMSVVSLALPICTHMSPPVPRYVRI